MIIAMMCNPLSHTSRLYDPSSQHAPSFGVKNISIRDTKDLNCTHRYSPFTIICKHKVQQRTAYKVYKRSHTRDAKRKWGYFVFKSTYDSVERERGRLYSYALQNLPPRRVLNKRAPSGIPIFSPRKIARGERSQQRNTRVRAAQVVASSMTYNLSF